MKKGFTLIELIVVIAILGILTSLVIASMGKAKKAGMAKSVNSSSWNSQSEKFK